MTQEVLLVIPGTDGESVGHQALIEPDTHTAHMYARRK